MFFAERRILVKKVIVGAGCLVLFLIVFFPGEALAQTVAANGDFELEGKGIWEKEGGNTGTKYLQYNTTGSGSSWCCKREPGTGYPFGGYGGLSQEVTLIAGVTYQFSANICYLAKC